jgi:hypothetical protein
LAEFRTALEQEIAAASSHEASSGVPLVNGKRIGQIGGNTQYSFEIENALNLPGDAPGNLYLADCKPLEVSVVSVDGMVITLSVPEDLGPFVATARLQSNLTLLMRKLIERIEAKAGSTNVVGDRLLGAGVHGSVALADGRPYGLNPEQHRALATSLGFDATFIQGPPGTGKSRAIGAIASEMMQRQRSVLIASHTNIAVDQALLKMDKHLRDDDRQKGLVVRVGDPKDAQLMERPDLLLSTHVERRSEALVERRTVLERARQTKTEEVKALCKTIELCEWVNLAKSDIPGMREELNAIRRQEAEVDRLRTVQQELKSQVDFYTQARADAEHTEKTASHLAEVERSLAAASNEIAEGMVTAERIAAELSQARVVLGQTCVASWLVRKWKGLPNPEEQTHKVQEIEKALGEQGLALDGLNARLDSLEQERAALAETVDRFHDTYACAPKDTLQRAAAYETEVHETNRRVEDLTQNLRNDTRQLGKLLRSRLSALVFLGLADDGEASLEGMLSGIEAAYRHAMALTKDIELDHVLAERDDLNAEIQAMESELRSIEEDLKRVEELVIRDAQVVATTLTRTYLRDSIQNRTFDTVIVDEASMAPIPAVWVAASVATSSGVLVGDPKQLPPIVISTQELATKWLGRDIFEAAGITDANPSFVHLTEQYRMHPKISTIANSLIYDGKLTDAAKVREEDNISRWYNHDWGYDSPVLLVDTGNLNAWVTSVPRTRGASRLNFLSAAVCIDIVGQLLQEDRPVWQDGKEPRVLIVSPYRPHTRLLEIMASEEKLIGEIRVGTAHSFQGSEADVVIFDLVNDEPHFRVRMFTPKYDSSTKRLVNVALTRARRRLIIIGDFDYIWKLSKNAFLGGELIPFLRGHYPSVSAADVVKKGLAARAAQAQATVYGGAIVVSEARVVVTQEGFDKYLRPDIAAAKEQIVIYSPFLTQNRLSLVEPQLKAAMDRGVHVYVVTRPHCNRGKRELPQYRFLERTLQEWGVVVIHKRGMHEKLIFIDNDILWDGSLNPLSFRDTGEHMERRISKRVFAEYAQTLRLQELLQGYASGPPACPICQREVFASEGRDDPYFWRCVCKDCYSRAIDQPGLQNGMITCASCGHPVEYGEWGGKPAWRCKVNRRHHQRLARTHLRLPRMRAMIPTVDLRKLQKYFGTGAGSEPGPDGNAGKERFLF